MTAKPQTPPGPPGRTFFRSPILSGKNPLANLASMARTYGDVTFWRFLHINSFLFVHPKDGVRMKLHRR